MTSRSTLSIRTACAAAALGSVTLLAACGGGSGEGGQAALVAKPKTSAPSSTAAPAAPSPSTSSPSAATSATAKPKAQPKAVAKPKVKAKPTVAVKTTVVTTTVTLRAHVVRQKDADLVKGKVKVVKEGSRGLQKLTIRKVTRGERVLDTKVLKRTTVKAPVDRVLAIGTKAPVAVAPKPPVAGSGGGGGSSTSGMDLRRMALWNRIAQRESGGNWSINTGNGYYGGLQFSASTWLSAGGGKFAPRADLATREEQITIANALFDRVGGSPWSTY